MIPQSPVTTAGALLRLGGGDCDILSTSPALFYRVDRWGDWMKAQPRRSINVYGVARVSGDTKKQRGGRLVKTAQYNRYLAGLSPRVCISGSMQG